MSERSSMDAQDPMSDQAFEAALAAVERGAPLPGDLSADDAADLVVAARLFAQRVVPAESQASRVFADAFAARPAAGEDAGRRTSAQGRVELGRARRWLPEAAVLLAVVGLGAVVVTQLPRITRGPEVGSRPTATAGATIGGGSTAVEGITTVGGVTTSVGSVGAPEGTVAAPSGATPAPPNPTPAPLTDTATGQVLEFRGNRVLFDDPEAGKIVRTLDTDVRREDIGQADDGPLPITNALLDPDRRILYLDFITYVSTPWSTHTLVAYDLESGQELGRGPGSSSYVAAAAGGALYGASWNRMGVSHIWKWRDGRPELFSDNWGGVPMGLALDPGRGRVYVATRDQLRVFDAATMMLLRAMPLPFQLDVSPEHPSSLVGYDAGTDRLFFVVDGRLEHLRAEDIELPPAVAPAEASPPRTAVRELRFAPGWPADPTLFGVWDSGVAGPACEAFGQTGGPLLVSADAGRTWKRAGGNLRAICDQVSALAVLPASATDRPPVLVAGVPGLGAFRSEDGGAWWHPSGGGLTDAGIAQLRLAPGGDGTLFAAGPLGALHLSGAADAGRIWRGLGQNLPVFDISPDFAADGTLMGAGYGEEGAAEIRVSRDRGASWQRAGPVPDWADASRGVGAETLSLAPLFSKWGVAFLYHSDGALYRTADGGRTWAKVLGGLEHATVTPWIVYGASEENRPVYLLTATSDDPARDPAAGRLRYFSSGDGGQTWQERPVEAGDPPSTLAPAPDFATSGRLLVGTVGGDVVERRMELSPDPR